MTKDGFERILNVEDNKGTAMLIERGFRRKGVLIETAHNFSDAIMALEGKASSTGFKYAGLQNYTLLLLDQNLNEGLEKRGSDIAEIARNMGSGIPIIMFSGGDLREAIEKTRRLRGVYHLSKPLGMEELYQKYMEVTKISASHLSHTY